MKIWHVLKAKAIAALEKYVIVLSFGSVCTEQAILNQNRNKNIDIFNITIANNVCTFLMKMVVLLTYNNLVSFYNLLVHLLATQ